MRTPFKTESWGFLAYLGAISAMTALATDMGLPAFNSLEKALAATPGSAVMTLSLFLVGYALTPLICGPLADMFGRKPVLIFGLIAFTLSAFGVTAATSMDMVLVFRTLQGAGAGFCVTMPVAVIQDLFEGDRARSYQGQVNAVLGFAPLVAPILGNIIMKFFHWRVIYAAQGVFGLVLLACTLVRFLESLPLEKRQRLNLPRVGGNYLKLLGNRAFLTAGMMITASYGVLFAYISSSSMVFMQAFGISGTGYSFIFATTAFCLICGSFTSACLSRREVPSRTLLAFGTALTFAGAGISAGLTAGGIILAPVLAAAGGVANFCYGLIGPNAVYEALQARPEIRGSAAGLLRCIQMLMGSAASALVAFLAAGDPSRAPAAMSGVMFFFGLTCPLMYFLWRRAKAVA